MSNPNDQTLAEIALVTKQLKYEGKVDRDTLEWFTKGYSRNQREQGVKRKHAEQTSPVQNITL